MVSDAKVWEKIQEIILVWVFCLFISKVPDVFFAEQYTQIFNSSTKVYNTDEIHIHT